MGKSIMSLIGLLILSIGFNSCAKDETNNSSLSEKRWHKKEYKSYINGKEYNLQVEYQEKGRGIKFDKSTPQEVLDFFKKNDASLVVHVVNDEVYYYANLDEFQKNTIFGDSNLNKNILKSYNGAKGIFYEHPRSYNNGGRTQIDELKTIGYVNAPYSLSPSTPLYTLPSLYNGQPINNTVYAPVRIFDWHGANPWVGHNFNDQITIVGADHFDKNYPVHMVCFEHDNYWGKRIVISKSSPGDHNWTDLRWHVMSYGIFWNTNWDDEISSHYTIQCPAWLLGSGHTIQI